MKSIDDTTGTVATNATVASLTTGMVKDELLSALFSLGREDVTRSATVSAIRNSLSASLSALTLAPGKAKSKKAQVREFVGNRAKLAKQLEKMGANVKHPRVYFHIPSLVEAQNKLKGEEKKTASAAITAIIAVRDLLTDPGEPRSDWGRLDLFRKSKGVAVAEEPNKKNHPALFNGKTIKRAAKRKTSK